MIDSPNTNFPVPSQAADLPSLQSERMFLVREAYPTNNLRDYASIFFKHKADILVTFVVLCVIFSTAALVYKYWIYEPDYKAKSSLLVRSGWENYSPELSLEKRQAPAISQAELVGSEATILGSRELKEKVIRTLKPEIIFPMLVKAPFRGLSNSEAALVLFEKHLAITPSKTGTGNVIEVVFNDNNPTVSAAVVNELVDYYIDKRSEIYKDPKSVLFLEKKADEYKQKLAESEDRMKTFRDETKIISFDEQRSLLLKQRSDLGVALNATANGMKEVQEKIGELEKQLSSLSKTTATAGSFEVNKEGQARLLTLQLQEKDLLAKYKENNPLVVNVRGQIEMVKKYIATNSVGDAKPGFAPPDPVYQEVQKQLLNNKTEASALKVRFADVTKQLGELNAEIQSLEALENRYKELAREAKSNEEKYHGYRQRLEEAKVYDELDRQKMTSVSVIERASAPLAPVNVRPLPILLAVAFGLAFFGSLGITYLRELGKQVMSTALEAEKRLDLPVLITIPIKS